MNFLNYKIIGAPKKFKNQLRPLDRPGSVNFCQNFWNLSHETVPLKSIFFQLQAPISYSKNVNCITFIIFFCVSDPDLVPGSHWFGSPGPGPAAMKLTKMDNNLISNISKSLLYLPSLGTDTIRIRSLKKNKWFIKGRLHLKPVLWTRIRIRHYLNGSKYGSRSFQHQKHNVSPVFYFFITFCLRTENCTLKK